ncbi:hypothetical protein N3C_2189 [Clostridium sp. N3C]|nr:hypothetical protein [Clostridium sp. N3C]SCN25155.1 hypothetical protein N3C_2189 [Clostridium sp. N3C]
MKKVFKLLGDFFLGIAASMVNVAPASISSMAVEEMPESMKNKR